MRSRTHERGRWKPPSSRRVRAVRNALRRTHGQARLKPHRAPLEELILTVLSQNTNDRNRDVAYQRLRRRFSGWQEVAQASENVIEEAIRPGGISRVKAKRIKEILAAVKRDGREPSLDWLADLNTSQARSFLEGLPGVGRKTAACVLLFSFGRPEMPVDTHVYRVCSRLELIRSGASFEEAHETLQRVVAPEDVYELHINLIRHGRRVCRPRPRCGECSLRRSCRFWRGIHASPSKAGKREAHTG